MHHNHHNQSNFSPSSFLLNFCLAPLSAPAVPFLRQFSPFCAAFCRSGLLLILVWLLLVDHFAVCLRANRSPKILDNSMQNVTAMRGDTAEFRCRVENGAKSKVAFFRDELPPKLIAYDESVFRRTDKYELLARVNGGREWILRIRDIQEDDAGLYICQLNTNPVLSRKGLLELRIPPSISRSSTPGAVEVREGNNVTMTCAANGNPKPTIVWRRSDRRIIRYNEADGYGDTVHKGAELTLSRVSRRHMGEYVCVASNGIPPDETLAIKLHVLFEPVVVPQTMVAEAPLNALVVRIACTVEAWPRPNVVWMFDGQTLHDSTRYGTEQSVADRYKSVHLLEIRKVQKGQFGVYKCLASNDYGSHFGEIRLIDAFCARNALSPQCLRCDFPLDCPLGAQIFVNCTTPTAMVNKNNCGIAHGHGVPGGVVRLRAKCRFCWQLDQSEIMCDERKNCSTSEVTLHRTKCRAKPNAICAGRRHFFKNVRCHWTSGHSWRKALFLSVTLGGFGVDRFYLGHWKSAIGKLFSFGGLGVWTLLDIVLIAFGYIQPADESLYI